LSSLWSKVTEEYSIVISATLAATIKANRQYKTTIDAKGNIQ